MSGEFDSIEGIRSIGIHAGNRTFRLGDIAEVRRGFVDPPVTQMRFNGTDAMGLAVSMRKGGDVIRLGTELDETVKRVQANLPVGVQIHAVSDQPRVVEHSVHEFKTSLAEAVVIVLAVSFLSLGFRTGLVVALCIPLVLALTFLAMYLFGIDLQRISLGALIIALGLLVDDAIIAVEMMALKLEQGWDKFRAATYAYTATAFPMLTGTLITAAGFLPVGFARSGTGEYVVSLFQVVGISLVLSWIVAVLFTPYIGFKLLKEHPHAAHDEEAVYRRGFYVRFRRFVDACLVHRRWVIGITFALFAGSLLLFKLVPQQFFPASDRPELMVDLWMPQASTFEASAREVRDVEAKLRKDPDVVAVTSYVGTGSPRFYLPLDVQTPNLNLGELMVMTKGGEARERVRASLQRIFDHELPNVRGRVNRLENGPPVGYPVQFRVFGGDDQRVREIAGQVADLMRTNPHVRHVNQDWGERTKRVQVDVDQDKARALGISSWQIKAALEGSLTGTPITQFREGDQDIDVVSRLVAAERTDLNNLKDAKIYLREGKFVPVSQVARLTLASEESQLWRRNRVPTLTVRADLSGAEAPDVTRALLPGIEALAKQLPLGYGIDVGGAYESSAKAEKSILAVMPVTIIVVLAAPDGAAARHEEDGAGPAHGAAGADRGERHPGRLPHSLRLRRDAGRDRPGRDDHPQLRDPGGPDRPGTGGRRPAVDRHRGGCGAAAASHPADRAGSDPCHGAADALGLLGPDGLGHHGRTGSRHAADALLPSGAVRRLLPGRTAATHLRRTGGKSLAMNVFHPSARWALLAALGLFSAAAHAVDLVTAYEAALRHDPAKLGADQARVAGRELAVQGDALLRPRISLEAGVNRIHDRSSGNIPPALAPFVSSSATGTVRQAGGGAHAALVRRERERAEKAASPAVGPRGDAVRPRQPGPRPACVGGLLRRAPGGGCLARRAGGEGRARAAAGPRPGAIRRGAQQDHGLAGNAGALRPGRDEGDLRAQHPGSAPRRVPRDHRLARRQPGRTRGRLRPQRAGSERPGRMAGARRGPQHPRAREALPAGDRHGRDRQVPARRAPDIESGGQLFGHGAKRQSLAAGRRMDRRSTGSVGLQFSVPLYAGGGIDSRERESIAKQGQAEQDLATARRDVRLRVQDAFLAVTTGVSRVASLRSR